MKAIVITPKSQAEFKFIRTLINKLGVLSIVMSEEELEDIGLSHLLRNVDREIIVSKKSVFGKLKK